MNVGKLCRFVHLFDLNVIVRKSDVVFHLVAEKKVVLRHVSDCVSDAVNVAIHYVHTVDKHLVLLHVVQSQKRVDKRCFAAADFADNTHTLARIDG